MNRPISSARFGVVFRLTAGLGATALLAVLASAFAIHALRTAQDDFDAVASRQLPGVVAAGHLARLTEVLVANAPELMAAETPEVREVVAARVADGANRVGELIAALGKAGVEPRRLEELQAYKADLAGNLRALDGSIRRRQELVRERDALQRSATRLAASVVAERMVLLSAEAGAANGDLAVREVFAWLDGGVLAVRSALSTSQRADLDRHLEDYRSALRELERRLPGLSEATAKRLALFVSLLRQHGDPVHSLGIDLAAVEAAGRTLLARNEVLAEKLVGAVAAISDRIVQEVAAANDRESQAVGHRTNVFALAAGLAILAGVLLAAYLKRAVTDRLRRLQGCMGDHHDPATLQALAAGRDEIAEIARALGYFIEAIEEREHELRRNEERYRTLYHRTPVMLHSVDAQARLTTVSDYWLETMGYERDEVIGRRNTEFLTEASRQYAENVLVPQFFATGVINNAVLQARKKNGEIIDVLVSSIVAHDEFGHFEQSLTVLTDITDQKRIEAALAAKTVELERSNRELEEFAYVASHDLREPLRMISAYVGLLKKRYHDKLDSDASEFIDFAADGAARMDRLILDLLEYSRVGRKQLPLEPVPVAEVVEGVLADLRLAIADSGATIAVPDALPTLLADRDQLSRLLLNLLGNAIKYRHPERSPEVRLEVERGDGNWVFGVIDNGIGIAAEHHGRIFQLFQRLHPRGEYDGTGIGLAIAKKIVERHGGRIWVEAQPGVGSVFRFTVPVLERAPGVLMQTALGRPVS